MTNELTYAQLYDWDNLWLAWHKATRCATVEGNPQPGAGQASFV